ncbi:hypothetical protein BBJ28_00019441 [Nothophytophthora sp. Chile5]|nr:hypothetical protein BBJ28_00019441 [Nothophytophthora sp. Chile5]
MADVDEDQLTAMTPAQKKLFELRMKMNAGRKANKKVRGLMDQEKSRVGGMAGAKMKKAGKKEKRKAAFGWDVFNQDSLYKGYKKRLVHLPTAEQSPSVGVSGSATAVVASNSLDDELAYGKNDKVEEVRWENVERMAQELEERIKARKKFSRRRQHYEGEDVDYINGQNRIFNRKASQAFDKYTVEIRQNLERGTAL